MTATHAAHVIVVGNEKGGSGKSTVALHLAVGLMGFGFRVVVADFDERQRSLLRYLKNRRANAAADSSMPCPGLYETPPLPDNAPDLDAYLVRIDADLHAECQRTDFLIIDTPGAATPLAKLAHRLADTLVTPMNDSWIDLDVLARVGPGAMALQGPSQYSRLVLDERRRRLKEHGAGTDWIVLRNRLSSMASTNHEQLGQVLEALAPRLGFRLAPGMAERVIYRELFLSGATVLDSVELITKFRLAPSHITARVEVRQLIEALHLPQVARKLKMAGASP